MRKIIVFCMMTSIVLSAQCATRRGTSSGTYRAIKPTSLVGNKAPVVSYTPSVPTEPEEVVTEEEVTTVDDIKVRYAETLRMGSESCTNISDDLDNMMRYVGISTVASAAGIAAGGTAAATGFMSSSRFKQIEEEVSKAESLYDQETDDKKKAQLLLGELEFLDKNDPSTLMNIRTVGSFAAGAANTVGAATSFIGLSQFDDLAGNIDACNKSVEDISRQRIELAGLAPEDGMLKEMDGIMANCGKMDSKIIKAIKSKLMASGAVVAVSAAAGLAGGVTSVMAKKNENMEKPANILAVVTTAGAAIGTVISGMNLASLRKNTEIAETCSNVF